MGIGAIGGVIAGLLVMMLVGLPIAALILKLSVRIAAGFSPGFLRSLGVVVLATVVGFFLNAAFSMLFGIGDIGAGGDPEAAAAAMAGAGAAILGAMGLSLLAGFLVTALLVNLLIKRADGSAIGFGRSLLVVLVYAVILTVVGIIVGVGLAMLGVGAAALAL